MMRGTFANIRLRNQLAPGTEGGWTTYQPGGEVMTIYDAAMKYKEAGVPLVILAGKEYGSGSSRDWAAKGTLLLGVRAVIAESFERIHRSNLVNMGVLPLQFQARRDRRLARAHRHARCSRLPAWPSGLTPGGTGHRARGRREDDRVPGHRAHRHAGGARGVPAWRHPAVRAAAARRSAVSAGPKDPAYVQRARLVVRVLGLAGVQVMLHAAAIKAKARELGFDACGIAPAARSSRAAVLRRVDRARLRRLDGGISSDRPSAAPTCGTSLPSARTVIVTATVYNTRRPYSTETTDPSRAQIARYAWGDDYHDVIGARLDALLAWMRETSPSRSRRAPTWTPGRCRSASTPSTPASAGLARTPASSTPSSARGSFSARSSAACRSSPMRRRSISAATCTLCLEACPTAGASWRPACSTATRCISYLTIEHRGDDAGGRWRAGIGSHVYGCDICQEVCPWNAVAPCPPTRPGSRGRRGTGRRWHELAA